MYRKVYYKSAQPVLDNVYCMCAVKVIISSQLWVLKNILFQISLCLSMQKQIHQMKPNVHVLHGLLSSLSSPFPNKARCRYSRDLNIGCPNSGNF